MGVVVRGPATFPVVLIEHHYPSPLGDLVALFTPQGLALLEFSENTKRLDREWRDVERYAGAAAELGAAGAAGAAWGTYDTRWHNATYRRSGYRRSARTATMPT